MNKKIISMILLTTIITSGASTTNVMAKEINKDLAVAHELNQKASIFDNTIAIRVDNRTTQGYAGFYFEENNGKLTLVTKNAGMVELADGITVKFLTQGGSVEISRKFAIGTLLEDFKNAIKKVELKYGDSIQIIPERKSDSVGILGALINNTDNYDYSLGISKELAETRAFKLTHDGIVVNRYYPI